MHYNVMFMICFVKVTYITCIITGNQWVYNIVSGSKTNEQQGSHLYPIGIYNAWWPIWFTCQSDKKTFPGVDKWVIISCS